MVAEVSEKANAPTFGIIDLYLGQGIIGGNLLSADTQGKRFAEISRRILKGNSLLDLDYREDFKATVDMNVVGKADGTFLEVQGTGEDGTFSRSELDSLLDMAQRGIDELIRLQDSIIED